MKRIEHVRFKLTDLIRAVTVAMGEGCIPTVPEALTYYWNWATGRNWRLLAVSNQMDPNSAILSLENHPQLEIRNEEFWNVLWEGEDPDGGCDLVEETGVFVGFPNQVTPVVHELRRRGWVETSQDELVHPKRMGQRISYLGICEFLDENPDTKVTSDIADCLEAVCNK